MDAYRQVVAWSAGVIIEPQELIRNATERMKQAATELRFETAAKIRAYVDSLSQLGKGSTRHMRRIEDFKYLSIQRGPRDNTAKAFLITPGKIAELLGLIDTPNHSGDILRLALTAAGRGKREFARCHWR